MNELIQIGPISPLRQRLIDDMTMRRFSKETQRNYLRDVGRFATWLGRSPHTASAEDVRQFQFEQSTIQEHDGRSVQLLTDDERPLVFGKGGHLEYKDREGREDLVKERARSEGDD